METRLEAIAVDRPEVRALYADFIRETDGPLGIDLEAEIGAGPPRDLKPPDGVLLLARAGGEPAGLGGVRHLDTGVAEVKSMYVSPAHRGRGLARAILTELERIAAERDCHRIRLDTSDYLTGAIALYRSAGLRVAVVVGDLGVASLWFERSL